jgi:eukaryotic-like serine/threonine-protein kinase
MTPERWQQVKEVLDPVLVLKPDERAAFLDRACATDSSLRRDVEELLNADQEAGTEFLNEPQPLPLTLAPESEGDSSEVADAWLGRRIGSYKVVEQIGVGGMGEVYRAFRADDQYRKEVALKVVRSGQDSGFVIGRFKNERQILASLDHPNIARLHDGGTTPENTPYFVMELIEGEPIDRYCGQHELTVTQRLKLFLQVCSAVQYAHQRLIIHRDLKPSNILVTSDGTPKLLDFGIAKILDAEAVTGQVESTLTIFRALTPGYASPEQIRGEAITTASDVYSLGVVLFELLTGHHPYRKPNSTPQEIARIVCEVEVEKPSTAAHRLQTRSSHDLGDSEGFRAVGRHPDHPAEKLSKRLHGDLDNIILMALRKEPQRRYASVEQFAEDIRRHLEDLPVLARKDTMGYRTSKFVARHRAGVAGAVIVAVTILAGLAVTLHEARIARSQQARAERRFNDVRKLANSMLFEIYDNIRDLQGSTAARKLLVDRALEYLDSLSSEANSDPSLMRELASAYERVGDVQGFSYWSNLGDTAGAMRSYQKALAVRQGLADASPKQESAQADLASTLMKVATVLNTTGDLRKAVELDRRSLTILGRLADAEHPSENIRFALADCHNRTGDAISDLGEWKTSLEEYEQGLSGFGSLSAAHPDNIRYRRMLAVSIARVGFAYEKMGDLTQALAKYREGFGVLDALVSSDPSNALLRRNLASARFNVGDTMVKLGDFGGVRELLKAAATDEALAAADPADMRIGRDLVLIYTSLADSNARENKNGPALSYYRKATTVAERRFATNPENESARRDLENSDRKIGDLYEKMARQRPGSDNRRRDLWQNAELWLRKSRGVWLDGKTSIPEGDARQVQALEKEIAKCDAALASLQSVSNR